MTAAPRRTGELPTSGLPGSLSALTGCEREPLSHAALEFRHPRLICRPTPQDNARSPGRGVASIGPSHDATACGCALRDDVGNRAVGEGQAGVYQLGLGAPVGRLRFVVSSAWLNDCNANWDHGLTVANRPLAIISQSGRCLSSRRPDPHLMSVQEVSPGRCSTARIPPQPVMRHERVVSIRKCALAFAMPGIVSGLQVTAIAVAGKN